MLSDRAGAEIRRELETDYWRLVNMKAERARLVAEIGTLRTRCAAWDAILTDVDCVPDPSKGRQ